jgi:hypothetical protein
MLTTNLSATVDDYTDAEVNRAIVVGKRPNNTYGNVVLSSDNKLEIALNKDAFGGLATSQKRPLINISAVYGLPERITETYTSGTGATAAALDSAPGREFQVECGTSVGGYGVIRSKKAMTYRAGMGSLARFTARFTTGIANSIQRAGLFNIGNELTFGYDSATFGILHRSGGRPEIRKLTITAAATGSETVTITLNTVAFNVAVTNSTAAQNAYEIAQGTFTGWTAYNVGSIVYFQASSVGAKSGTYSVSSTGALAGNYTQVMAGANVSDSWIYQSNWNKTTLTTSSDPFILDPTKGNVYQIQFQYLGYGAIKFFLENPNTGNFVLVHEIRYANAYTRPSLDIPAFKVGIIAASALSTTNLKVQSASMAAFRENQDDVPMKIHGTSGSKSSIGSTFTNVLALKKITIANNLLVVSDVSLKRLSVAVEGTKPAQVEVRLNPTFSTARTWAAVDEDTTITATSTGGTVSGGELLIAFGLGKSSDRTIDLQDLDIVLSNDDVISISVSTASGTTDAVAGIVWSDDQ